jgi:Protein of unknown function DUF86
LAASFSAGVGYEAFVADPRTVYAVTRCLEIISEASRRLPDELKAEARRRGEGASRAELARSYDVGKSAISRLSG